MILPDHTILELARKGMITPFEVKLTSKGVISYGLSSYGYDARVDRQWKVFKEQSMFTSWYGVQTSLNLVDPKKFDPSLCMEVETDSIIIPPHGFALAQTVETFNIPRDVLAICMGKSTYARCGVVVGCTPLEPEWRGTVTLEFSNTTGLPVKIYSGEGACQFLFFRGESAPSVSYADRRGKYMDQKGVTLPKVKD